MITSYALLRRDEELLQALDLRYVILDEAQHIKNPMSQTARSAKKLSSERRLALTGTPIENRLSELWSIFDFVSPGLLGQLKAFEERIARPIDRGDMETAQRLRATIKPFIMRRLKRDVAADLPDKIEQEMIVPLAEEQAKLYKQILGQVRKSVLSEVEKNGVSKAQIQILVALTRLRQVACDPRPTTVASSGRFARSSMRPSTATTACWYSASSCPCSTTSAPPSTPTASNTNTSTAPPRTASSVSTGSTRTRASPSS
jgi:SNF2 family DNA or RNA helicase